METIIARIADHEITESELDRRYSEMIDDCYPEVVVCGISFAPSRVLRELDETAYRCGFSDWLDAESDRVVEIGGNYYDREAVEKELDDWEAELSEDSEQLEAIAAFRKENL